jgi:formylglycine-generating enzyme required for sulfatase activity
MIRSSRTIGLAALCALAAGTSPTTWSAPPRQPDDPARSMKPYVETILGTAVTFEMLPIPGGTFTIGSPMNEEKRGEDEGPRHAVQIAPFWMGKCEVTWVEFPTGPRASGGTPLRRSLGSASSARSSSRRT